MTIKIIFNVKHGIFRPGDNIKGQLIIYLKPDALKDGVSMEWLGQIRIVGANGSIRDEEDIFKTTKTLYLDDCNNRETLHSKVLDFQLLLPQNLPSSINVFNKTGKIEIRYHVMAKIGGQLTITTRRRFIIIDCREVLTDDMAPVSLEARSTNSCLCINCKPPIEIAITMDKSKYVPGESALLSLMCNNRSSTSIKNVTISLHQEIVSKPKDGEELKLETVITKEKVKNFFARPKAQSALYTHSVKIPPLPPSREATYNVAISYNIMCVVGTPDGYSELFESIPISIASYPKSLCVVLSTMESLPPNGYTFQPNVLDQFKNDRLQFAKEFHQEQEGSSDSEDYDSDFSCTDEFSPKFGIKNHSFDEDAITDKSLPLKNRKLAYIFYENTPSGLKINYK